MEELINKLVEDVDYEFGEPWRLSEKTLGIVVPIIAKTSPTKRGYLVLEEVKDKVEIRDTGKIDEVEVRGNVDKPVFLRGGAVLAGKTTQSRALQYGVIVEPQKTEIVKVACVHASKGIRPAAFFNFAGYTPRGVEKALMSRSQSHVWASVNRSTAMMATGLASAGVAADFHTDDLVSAMSQVESFKEDVEKLLEKVPADLANQVGIAVLSLEGVEGIELFDHPESWTAFSKSIVRKYGDILTEEKETEFLEVNLAKVVTAIVAFLEKAKTCTEKLLASKKISETYAVQNDTIVGEYTTFKRKLMHVILTKKEKQPKPPKRRRPIPIFAGQPETPRCQRATTTPAATPYSYSADTTAPPKHYFEGKNSFTFLNLIKDKPKTWKELEPKFRSTRTLAKRAHEAVMLNLARKQIRPSNGKITYSLTSEGQEALKKAKQLYSR